MRELSLDEFASRWEKVEQAVDATPDIDPWCSGPDWTLAVNAGFADDATPILIEADDDAGFVALASYQTDDGLSMIGCLEPMWGFGTPIVGPDLKATTEALIQYLELHPDWDVMYLTGFPASSCAPKVADSEAVRPTESTIDIATMLCSLGQVALHPGIARQTANLAAGYEPWLSNRSSTFRRNLRKTKQKATEVELTIEDISKDPDIFHRLLGIEHGTWKGKDDSGITSTEMQRMYKTMFGRLSERDRLMAHVARLNDRDVGYIVGGLRNRRYRGLQLSYVDGYDSLSIGNLLQDHQIQLLCTDRQADVYDLGMDFGYKRSWADLAERSVAISVHPNTAPSDTGNQASQ